VPPADAPYMHIWATNASTTLESMVNPVIAACDGTFVPLMP
jgi:hypothetical protein